ncbi:glucose-6-phosphate dehydrogenase [Buchnera aphidicola (Taiwanaphis decaspermi)]|uniref:glucose-6-phosphate dehydrogenase n=1 Tax=Buchnera aphidicola TaxID=9 RepID=UPI0031B85EB5
MVIKKKQAYNLVIFGAKGDLAKRKLLPSLYQLEKYNELSKKTIIIGVGRANWNDKDYIDIVKQSLKLFMKEKIKKLIWKKFKKKLRFCNLDVNEIYNFNKLKLILNQKKRITINYFAVPPNRFKAICNGLGKSNLNKKPSRVIIEKPVGTCLKTCKEINNHISEYFKEKQVFRIDHYLGKETIMNLIALRFANSIFFNNWNKNTIDHVQITVAEEVGIEGRVKYFNKTGQTRDMIQNHLLQILSIVAMSKPNKLTADDIRDEKVKVLRSLRPINYLNVLKKTVRGQYTSGEINGKNVPSYLKELGENVKSDTETFVAMRVDIDNVKWNGVPFYLRTGKRLARKCSEIVIYFKNLSTNLFKDHIKKLPKNKLTIRLQPNEGIDLEILNKIPGLDLGYKLSKNKLNLNYFDVFKKNHLADAYERLLLESMRGIQSLFVRRDEVEESWKWIDNIIKGWKIKKNKPLKYMAGTWGPSLSLDMIKKDGKNWNNID